MKNIFLILFFSILIIQCSTQEEYFDKRYTIIKAKIFKIEEKNNIYVYHFKNSKIIGVFAKEKSCNIDTKSWKETELNQNYNLILHKPISSSLRSGGVIETLNGDFVWESDMKEIYYDDCKNICGKKIYDVKR